MKSQSLLDQYRELYGHYNDETLKVATINHPALLKGIIESIDIRGFSRAYAVEALSHGARPLYFDFILSCTKDENPFMREAAFMGLFNYYIDEPLKYSDLLLYFEECKNNEKGEGVIKKITSLLDAMNSELFNLN